MLGASVRKNACSSFPSGVRAMEVQTLDPLIFIGYITFTVVFSFRPLDERAWGKDVCNGPQQVKNGPCSICLSCVFFFYDRYIRRTITVILCEFIFTHHYHIYIYFLPPSLSLNTHTHTHTHTHTMFASEDARLCGISWKKRWRPGELEMSRPRPRCPVSLLW